MVETEKPRKPNPQSPEKPTFSFSLRVWPPSERTRDVVIKHLIDTLSSPSSFANRYGMLPSEETIAFAKIIEEESFLAAAAAAAATSAGVEADPCRGIEILQVYSKEISKRMLEMVRNKACKRHGGAFSSEEMSPSCDCLINLSC
ncbi:hypothetical protein P3X46_012549 [Hevea brasiliensis]|uniref:WPP domain-containing protein n=1 Tax=Hevea brasiliensis TaxID=3981 RepID=A0ABQ9MCP4_HEVBR|nr:MFP1 attachment factor 1 [Hevea brasiliensis]KAJ9177315.1 hypothetical protein P3X46_012549 [Hevea brasiliensis]